MNSHSVALLIAVFAFAPSALSESTCAAGESAQGECLLQSQSLEGQKQLVKEDEENADDVEEEGHEEGDEDVDTLDEGHEEGDEDVDTLDEEETEVEHSEETSALQSNETALGNGKCRNDYGDNKGKGLNWHSLEYKEATRQSGNVGEMKDVPFYRGINVCAKYKMNNHYANHWMNYACIGSTKGKDGPCKSKKGVNVDCYNGLCADKSNIKHDWSQAVDGMGCHRIDGLGGVGNRDRPYDLQLKDAREPSGKPALKLFDPNCKVLCETIPGCTGFTLLKARKAPRCFFFGGVSQASAEQSKTPGPSCQKGKCCAHKNYATYFVTRKR